MSLSHHCADCLFVFFRHLKVDLLVCLASLSFWITQVCLNFRVWTANLLMEPQTENSRFPHLQQLVQVMKQQCRTRPSLYHHHVCGIIINHKFINLFMNCYVSFTPNVSHKPSQKFSFDLVSPQNLFPKVLHITRIYFSKHETRQWQTLPNLWQVCLKKFKERSELTDGFYLFIDFNQKSRNT